jgi:hypothetical protein
MCGDGVFFEVPLLASDALVTTLHPLLENVLRTVDRNFLPLSFLFMVGKAPGRDLDCMADVLMA